MKIVDCIPDSAFGNQESGSDQCLFVRRSNEAEGGRKSCLFRMHRTRQFKVPYLYLIICTRSISPALTEYNLLYLAFFRSDQRTEPMTKVYVGVPSFRDDPRFFRVTHFTPSIIHHSNALPIANAKLAHNAPFHLN